MSDPDRTYRVKVKASTSRAVLVRIDMDYIKMEIWLPRSQVEFPDNVERGDELDVIIPGWLIQSEIGQPDF